MGKQKDFRHIHRKKDKKNDKTSKTSKSSCHEGYLKTVEGVVQAELESIASAKKIGRKVQKELERYPLLAKAVYLGCERVVDNILEASENVNVQIPDGSTPLVIAIENGYTNIVQKLLKKGADPKLLRQDGRNALMIAVAKNDTRSFTLIWNYWDKSNFWELNHTDSKGYTALTIAAEHGNSQLTKFLLSLNGIEVDKQTEEGRTALMFATTAGQINIVQKLLSSGADSVLEDKNGATAICLAISQHRTEIKDLFIESLDNKARDTYVKKRIELLSKPRVEDILILVDFYKDILFRVILEIKKSFDDGIALLEKYNVFVNLLTCMETHQHNTELLRIGFHLAVCLMYDKAEYSRYIVEELAEQYISYSGTNFSLKIMHNYRLKSLCDLRGAAFLTIHAASECHSGKIWLKSNYFQVLPFVKEFRMCFTTLTFWADGESVKAKIMFDRFVQILRNVEKEIKLARSSSPDIKEIKTEPADKDFLTSEIPSTSDKQQWFLVSNSKSTLKKSALKISIDQSATSFSLKRDIKKKSKKSKLRTKLQHKITMRKFSQRSSIKHIPETCGNFPALSPATKISQTGYADALKRNLNNEAVSYKSQKEEKILETKDVIVKENKKRVKVSSYSWLNNNKSSSKLQGDLASTGLQNENNENSVVEILNDCEKKKENILERDFGYSCKKVSHATNLMAFLKNMIHSESKRDKNSDQTEKAEQPEYSDLVAKESTMENYNIWKPKITVLRDILTSRGLKANTAQDNQSEITANSKSRNIRYHESGDEAISEIDKTFHQENPMIFLKNVLHLNLKTAHTLKQSGTSESPNAQRTVTTEYKIGEGQNKILHDTLSLKTNYTEDSNDISENATNSKSEEQVIYETSIKSEQGKNSLKHNEKEDTFDHENQSLKSEDEGMKNMNTGNKEASNVEKNNAINPTHEICLNSELNCKQTSNEKDISFCSKNPVLGKNANYDDYVILYKRKYEENYFQDLSFSFYREEVKETNDIAVVNSPQTYRSSFQVFVFENVGKPLYESMNKNITSSVYNDKSNQNNFISKLKSSKIYFPGNILNASLECRYSGHSLVTPEIFSCKTIQRHPLKRSNEEILIPSINNQTKQIKMLQELKNVFDLLTNGVFTAGNRKPYKRKLNSKCSLASRALSFTKIQVAIKSSTLYKFVLIYQRLILHKIVCQFLKSSLDVKFSYVHRDVSVPNSVHSTRKECLTEGNKINDSSNVYPQKGIEKLYLDRNYFTILKEYNTLVNLKTEFSKLLQAVLLYSEPQKINQTKTVRKRGARALKIINDKRNESSKFFQKSKKIMAGRRVYNDVADVFSSRLYGFKSQFINCQCDSKWHKVLHRIESCIPLESFFLGFTEQKRSFSTDSTMHELICSSGKVIYSSKDEHVLSNGVRGAYIGLMTRGIPVIVRSVQNSSNEALDLLSLKPRINHRNIATFYCLCSNPVDRKIFAVTELIEYSLSEYIKEGHIFDGKVLVQELVEAIKYLHGKKIVHGFLKPSNIMVTIDHRLKVSDFYQLDLTSLQYGILRKRNITSIGKSTLSNFCWRPYELIAAASETEARKYLTTAADIQVTGMLIYYILSKGKHPFGSSDLQCQENIRNGFTQLGPRPVDVESRDLILEMIKKTPSSRPSINQVTQHPYLWVTERRFQFLVTVSRKNDFFLQKPTKFAESLQDSCIEGRNWTSYIDCKLLKYISKTMNKTYVDYYADLLHFIVSINDNFEIMPADLKSIVHQPSLFISILFPTIFMSVYCVVRDNPYVQMQMALQSYFQSEY